MDFLTEYSALPSFLTNDSRSSAILVRAVGSDEDCPTDGYICRWDCSDCSDTPCSDTPCSDTPVYHKIPVINSFSISQTSAGVPSANCSWRLSNLESGATYEIQGLGSNNVWYTKSSGRANSTGSTTISFNTLGTYSVRLIVTNAIGYTSTRTTTVYLEDRSVSKWDWYASNGSASSADTRTTYEIALRKGNGGGPVSSFHYKVWNDMCDKVKEVLDYKGLSWDSTTYGLTFANTKMTASNRVLTAQKFNALRQNVGRHYSTGINEVRSNDPSTPVKASYFTTLAAKINDWIDQ